jgi:hypothetical protein
MVLLACEQHLTAPCIAKFVREDAETVRRWLKRSLVCGIEGLRDGHDLEPAQDHQGVPGAIADSRSSTTSQPRVTLLDVDTATLGNIYGRADRDQGFHRNHSSSLRD